MAAPQPEYSPEELHELLSGLMPEIPGYRVLRLLGRGGMSYVYLGVQESLDRQVAIKVIQPEALRDEISKLRFEREAQIIAKLQHPCIVGIYEIGRTEHGLLYYVLPYLSKGHLGQRDLRDDQRAIVEVLRALLWALDYAHGRGVVHRDVKAENVLFDNADRPLLTDFGIALSRRDRSRVTGRGLAVGSGGHMAPEQARGESVDGRADLYSLGILTFEMLTGYLPYKNSDPLGLALMHAVDPLPALPEALAHWQPFIHRAMGKLPKDRYPDARAMMVALDEVEAAIHRLGLPESPGAGSRQSWHALGNWARATRERHQAQLAAAASTEPAATADPQPEPPQEPNPASRALAARVQNLRRRADESTAHLREQSRLVGARARASLRGIDRNRIGQATAVIALLAAGLLIWRLWPEAQAPAPTAFETPANGVVTQELPDRAADAAPPGPEAAGTGADRFEPIQLEQESASGEPDAPDPLAELPADERLLAFAEEQIARRSLSQPPGNNAYESLLAAESLSADPARLAELGDAWLQAATPYIAGALAEGRDDSALALLERGRELARRLRLQDAPALGALREALSTPLIARFEALTRARDVDALATLKARILTLGLPSEWFEPHWSRKLILARPGEPLPGAPQWRLVSLPEGRQAGLAMLSTPVSVSEYAAFARDSGRGPANCRVRTAMLTLKKRSWQDPGFAQQGDHPVVCVSPADARAYASWLGAREGATVRLPAGAEWNRLAGHGVACAPGASCSREGTRGGAQSAASALGIHASRGNVREWVAEPGAAQRGESWRDVVDRRAGRGDDALDASRGYDDIGFRVVRSVPAAELEVAIPPRR
ncbi:bifunctional serine/threonine-protein kinase/formylglycine-generating enzyme family protein [Pseudomarimonas salicorniae]|uniref:Bifunctional serine/threonine-protein kinase/formylglycine-generating enzyme family protein n=1 Tax=Pseudomarimonas salicorniae TaxID=2933270 RepID=A0ABT0GL02_9GAMM|nr:bifunctional serine/threonine-protein kinase/formylglycine-generating enzyme family protein [Lysobacter sp. CAU 1642]MCK7594717.1 bifunctional serine/threonine-protein kinase/formylglycine-generating enzyme family protein [Lysobacter sp. CAU 1642]